MGTRRTIGFERVQRSRVLRFKCAGVCKKPFQQSIRAECTINPYNVNPDKTVKNREEVGEQADALLALRVADATAKRTGTPCELCGGPVVLRA